MLPFPPLPLLYFNTFKNNYFLLKVFCDLVSIQFSRAFACCHQDLLSSRPLRMFSSVFHHWDLSLYFAFCPCGGFFTVQMTWPDIVENKFVCLYLTKSACCQQAVMLHVLQQMAVILLTHTFARSKQAVGRWDRVRQRETQSKDIRCSSEKINNRGRNKKNTEPDSDQVCHNKNRAITISVTTGVSTQ